MKKIILERNLVVVLFVMVLVVFSLAHRDTKKLDEIYRSTAHSIKENNKLKELAAVPVVTRSAQ